MTTYWLSDFCSLFNSSNINPFSGDDKNFKFNSLTRLIIVVIVVFAILFNSHANEIFLAGCISLFLSVIIYMLTYNSAEMSIELNKELKTYTQAQELIESQQGNLKVGLSKMGAETIKDYNVNVENEVTLDYSPPNTQLKKSIYFFEGNKMPSQVVATKREPSDYLSMGKQVPTGTAKQLHSLIGKNLSFT
tara:strand:- start:419 stop:991 length:573 start_codon:yes stop_codon:yes gene_type:complete